MNNQTSPNLYKILNLDRSASSEEIKRAYRRAARRYHPDTGGLLSSADKFHNVSEAYRVLSDSDLRQDYDAQLKVQNETTNPSAADTTSPRRERPPTRHTNVNGSKEESRQSRRQSTTVNKDDPSLKSSIRTTWRGHRHKQSTKVKEADNKHQSLSLWKKFKTRLRKVTKTYDLGTPHAKTPPDFTVTIDALQSIQGTTREFDISESGEHSNPSHIRINVKIPPGVSDGDVLKVTRGGPKGVNRSFHVQVKITAHPYFNRENNDIVILVPLTFQESVRGTTVEIPSIDGPLKVAIPPHQGLAQKHGDQQTTYAGQGFERPRLRIRGKGLPLKGGQRSNLIIETYIVAPNATTKEQLQALDTLEKAYSQNVRQALPLSLSPQRVK